MNGCQTCGGFGDRHDPIAHGDLGRSCTCAHPEDFHGRRDAQTAWQSTCYADADCDCDDFEWDGRATR